MAEEQYSTPTLLPLVLREINDETSANDMFGISRIDDGRKHQHCWFVRLGGTRPKIAKSFSDKKYGGKSKSFDAARAFRDQYLVLFPQKERLPKYDKATRWERRLAALAQQGMCGRVYVGVGIEGDKRARELGIGSSWILSNIRHGRQNTVFLSNFGGSKGVELQPNRVQFYLSHRSDFYAIARGDEHVIVGAGEQGHAAAVALGVCNPHVLAMLLQGERDYVFIRRKKERSERARKERQAPLYIVNKEEAWQRRKESLGAGMRCVIVGTGEQGLEKAKNIGVIGAKLLSLIHRGKRDRVYLQFIGNKRSSFDAKLNTFKNDITQDMYNRARGVVDRQCRELSEIEKDEIVERAIFAFASADIQDKSETFLEKLTTRNIRFFYMKQHRRHDRRLDLDGNVETYFD